MDDSSRVYRYYPISTCTAQEYLLYDLSIRDRSLWPVCVDAIPFYQDYLGLITTSNVFYPRLGIDTLSKYYTSAVVSSAGDTVWHAGVQYGYGKDWLAKAVGLGRRQSEASSPLNLIGAVISGRRYGTISDVDDSHAESHLPKEIVLHQNFPNPFNPMTTISYGVPSNGHVTLEVFDILGREVATLVDRTQEAGTYAIEFDANEHPAGVYFYRLKLSEYIETRKMALVK